MSYSIRVRQAVRLLGAAAAAGALSIGLLAAPVSAGAVNGVRGSVSKTDVNGVGHRSKADVNGVHQMNGAGVQSLGRFDRGAAVKADVNGVKVNGVKPRSQTVTGV